MRRATNTVRAVVPRSVRNWLRSPGGSLRWLQDQAKFSCGLTSVVEMRPGWKILCHPSAYRCAYYVQKHDPEQIAELDSFISTLSPGTVLFDLGAHFGLFSLAAIHYGGPSALAVAVDPSPIAANILRVQATLNSCEDRLQIIQAAVNESQGRQSMVAVGVQASGYYVAPDANHTAGELTETKSVTIDSLVEKLGCSPTHIKIDVEGYEAAVLKGGKRLLSQKAAPLLFVELHNEIVRGHGGDPAETLNLMREHGYKTFGLDGSPITDEVILSKPLVRITAQRSSQPG